MDVVSISPFRAGSVLWRSRPDRWTLTVVCKATYALEPGESPLAPEQEEVNAQDGFWDGDPRRSVHAPSDMAPFKPRADVALVGHAYAPRSEVVRSLVARLLVGEMEKAVEVFCPRVLGREGELREGQRWSKMPLYYEYAAGGLETWNPVGIGPSAPADLYGQRPLPNLQPPGLRVAQWGDIFVPIGFGPISPSWRLRQEKLGRRAGVWSDEGWTQIALDDDFDGEFFQMAPPDQQLDALHDDERLVLEYLNPDHPSLTTKLAGVHPHAFVEIPGSPPRDLVMTADTLWINTDRAICTLTWRGQVAVDGPEQQGRVLIALEEAGQRLTWPAIAGQPPGSTATPDAPSSAPRPVRRTLPFVPIDPPTLPPPAPTDPEDDPSGPQATPQATGPRQTLQMATHVPSPASLPTWPSGEEARAAPVSQRRIEAPPAPVQPDAPRTAPSTVPERALELCWFTPRLGARLREVAAWAPFLPARVEGVEPSAAAEVAAVLTRALVTSADLEGNLFAAIGEGGALAPRPLLLAGELSFSFDEVEALRATITAAMPIARGGSRLAELLEHAQRMAQTDLQSMPQVAEALCASLRGAWAEVSQVAGDHLGQQVERSLLSRRCYQRRDLLGEKWIRALFTPAPEATAPGPVPTYLPAGLVSRLPLFLRFPARIVADVLPQQDQYEASPVALAVVALAREITRTR